MEKNGIQENKLKNNLEDVKINVKAAKISGFGYLIMSILAPIANF